MKSHGYLDSFFRIDYKQCILNYKKINVVLNKNAFNWVFFLIYKGWIVNIFGFVDHKVSVETS